MKYFLKPLLTFIFISRIYEIIPEKLTPLSVCTKGRISSYTGWEKGGSCGFNSHSNATGVIYLYPAAPNEALFNNSAQCGICYEMVGPYGAIRVRVEDSCPKDDELGLCTGDMFHFNVANNGSKYILGENDYSNVTFRMVSCDYSGNIKIQADENIDEYRYSFTVLDHNLGVDTVRFNEEGTRTWIKLTRDKYNFWTYDEQTLINFPVTIRIYSINGDFVTVVVDSLEAGKIYEANGNFKVPNNTYYNVSTLKKVEIPNNTSECCSLDNSGFSPIYKSGKISDMYNKYEQKVTVDNNSGDNYQGKPSMKVTFQSFGKLIFQSNFPIRADQYSGVSISIKTNKTCTNCLYFRAYDLQDKNQILSLEEENRWKTYKFDFSSMGIENNQFNGIVLHFYKSTTQPFEISIGSIELIENEDAPDAGVCLEIGKTSGGSVIPVIPNGDSTDTPIKNGTSSNETEQEKIESDFIESDESVNDTNTNGTYISDTIIVPKPTEAPIIISNVNVDILSLESMSDYPEVINIKCNSFRKIENENMALLFIPSGGSNYVQTESCILTEEIISSFSCKLPHVLSDGVYYVQSPSNNRYIINYSNNIIITNGLISPNGNNEGNNNNEGNSTQDSNEYSRIVITNSVNRVINKGDRIKFDITPINANKYYLENNEIIFVDKSQTKALYLKNCEEDKYNNQIISIACSVSNNIIKANYTTIASGQPIDISTGQEINLIGTSSIGGAFSEVLVQEVNTNLTSSQRRTFSINFDILYYNSEIKPSDLFPHKVYLYGVKSSSLRNLDDNQYNYQIEFPNCTAGAYSFEEPSAIGSIRCRFPDYVPAGTYSKLVSDGFDIMPNSKVNLVFKNDFNRNSNSNSTLDDFIPRFNKKDDSSSSSKKWIVWVIIAILVVVLAVIVVVACVVNKKGGDEENDETSKSNDSKNISNNSQSNMKSENSD